jgi:hypothetical protein
VRDIETIDPSCDWWRLFAVRLGSGGPLPSIDVADALLDERSWAGRVGYKPATGIFTIPDLSN